MYIKQVIDNRESWWGYIVTVVLIAPLTIFIFSIPHGLILASKAFGDEELMAKIASNDIVAIMSVLEPNQNLFLMLLPFVGMILAVFFATKFIHKNSIKDLTTSREKIDWNRVFFSFALWGSISAFMIFTVYLFISPENYDLNLEELKSLNVPFGLKLNGFIKTNPKPNYTGAYNKSKTGNPNEFLGQRKDLTPDKMTEFAIKFKEAGATILGGCCETRPAHIKAFSKLK